jgi:hypothetical protein
LLQVVAKELLKGEFYMETPMDKIIPVKKTVIYYRKDRKNPLECPDVKWIVIRVTKELSFVWDDFSNPFKKDILHYLDLRMDKDYRDDYFVFSREQAEILFEFKPSDKVTKKLLKINCIY